MPDRYVMFVMSLLCGESIVLVLEMSICAAACQGQRYLLLCEVVV